MTGPMNLIFYNQAMDRSAMKQLIGRLVAYLGTTYTAHILDQLKTIGFKNATQAGISLGVDDLLTAPSKAWLIQDAEYQTHISEEHQRYGDIHAVEKLRQLIETWYTTSEYLRHEMNPNFRITDPLNPVHMMSFSGARGSSSQVHQLVGMRGLMSDPQGQIIDLPIQSNFREGLSLTEYIISCYGARKGVVDTAVRTSDAGYLTRRLVEVVQHIVVRRIDCGSTQGIRFRSIEDRKGNSHLSFQNRLTGRVLANYVYINKRCIAARNQDIGTQLASRLAHCKTESILVRSTLTCKNMYWVCQLCYGWSLNHGNLIELGEAVGIIAGQSIGEPGTQLTLRTFHTGGVFTGDIAEHVRAPFNGIVCFDSNLVKSTRTRHGHPAWMCTTTLVLNIKGQGKQHTVTIPIHSLLLVNNDQKVKSKQVIAEIRATTTPFKEKVHKYIYSNLDGEMHWSRRVQHASKYTHGHLHSVLTTGHVWILSSKIGKSFGADTIFYKDQDHISVNIPLAKQETLFSEERRSFLYKSLLNEGLQKKKYDKKPTKNINTILQNNNFLTYSKSIYSSAILSNYKILQEEQSDQINLILRTHKNNLFYFSFVLSMPLDGIIRNEDILATYNSPSYKTEASGILKYRNIKTDSTNRITDGWSNEQETTKCTKPKFKVLEGGSLFWIPEEIYSFNQSLSSVFVQEGDWIQPGTQIAKNLYSKTGGLIKIRKTPGNTYEISILPGNIYNPKELEQGLNKHDTLVSPDEEIIEGISLKTWSYLQWIVLPKGRPFLLIRPVVQYDVPTVPDIPSPNLLSLLGKKEKIRIEIVQYLFYEDGQHIKAFNGTQLVQTCLVLKLEKDNLFNKAKLSCAQIKIGNITNRYLQITLSESHLVSEIQDNNKDFFQKEHVISINNKSALSSTAKEIFSKHQGIVRSLPKNNKETQGFLTLSSSDQLRVTFSNYSLLEYDSKKTYSQTDRFSKSLKNDDSQKNNRLQNSSQISSDAIVYQKIEKIESLKSLGLIGHLHKISSRIWRKKILSNVCNQLERTRNSHLILANSHWYLLDEKEKFYEFDGKNVNPVTYTNLNSDSFSKPLPILSLGQFVSEGLNINSNNSIPESGQIIALNPNNFVIRLAKPYLVTMGATIHSHYGEVIKEGDTLLTLVYERLKTGDIIQGLPKVEQLLEARPINTVSINLEDGFENWNKDITRFLGNPWGFFLSARISIEQSQIDLVDQIQKVYQSQGVYISDKHVEIIVRQMTSKVITLEDSMANGFLPGELIELPRAQRMNRALQEPVPYKPILLGITKVSLNTQSFISEASFQETTRVLTRAALRGRTDWLKGLKENVVLGGVIPAGTGCQETACQIRFEKEKKHIQNQTKDLFSSEVKNVLLGYKQLLPRNRHSLHKILKQPVFQKNPRDLANNLLDKQKKNNY